ncbi:MAG: formylglycine-generating enzyme family protein [Treponema sp.]|jgi:formylglycine-generating enzyme required for sulfatase activity|nr:formylglycine-generating enzyme family protein [Treponema sp.]
MKPQKFAFVLAVTVITLTGIIVYGNISGVSAQEFPATPAMVRINRGIFTMGSPANERGRETNETQHQVTLTREFFMGKYPVTQAQYIAVMGENPSYFKGNDRPVEQVSWYHSIVFCNRLSIQEGLTPVYSINGSTNPAVWEPGPTRSISMWEAVTMNINANGYRLPTEAEWEYVCRAGTSTAYSTGKRITGHQATHFPSVSTTPVSRHTANAWGLFDMHGNVFEWCWDWYGTYPGNVTDYSGPGTGDLRIIRGGSWGSGVKSLRSASRNGYNPLARANNIGFRVVRR